MSVPADSGGLAAVLPIIDGCADLDPDGRPGLGARARDEFGVPVIGMAKSAFRTATHAIAVRRGASARTLYVTAARMPHAEAAGLVRHMAASTGCPTPCVASIASPAMACRSRSDAEGHLPIAAIIAAWRVFRGAAQNHWPASTSDRHPKV